MIMPKEFPNLSVVEKGPALQYDQIYKRDEMFIAEIDQELGYIDDIIDYLEKSEIPKYGKQTIDSLKRDTSDYKKQLRENVVSARPIPEITENITATRDSFRKSHHDLFVDFIRENIKEVGEGHEINYDVTQEGWLRVAPPFIDSATMSRQTPLMRKRDNPIDLLSNSRFRVKEIDYGGSILTDEQTQRLVGRLENWNPVWKVDLGNAETGIGKNWPKFKNDLIRITKKQPERKLIYHRLGE